MDWQAMLALGAYHGINPGMGWLFAVALGMQERSARAVWRALPPLVLGHAIAVAVVVGVATILQLVVPLTALKVAIAFLLIGLGAYRLWTQQHPRFGGMRVGFRDLTLWSFLMASAHGAGLMVLPFVMSRPADVLAAGHAAHGTSAASTPLIAGSAVGAHTLAYFVTMAVVAQIVYNWMGLKILRTAWFNLDWLWAIALVATGIFVLV